MEGEAGQWTATEVADDDSRLSGIESLVTQGLMLRALRAAEAICPLEALRGARARVLAAWLADHLGAEEFAWRSYLRAARATPHHPGVRFFYTYLVFRERGPVQAWLLLTDYTPPETATPLELADLASLRAQVLASLRDHRLAEKALAECNADVLKQDCFALTEALLLEQRGDKKQALALLERAFAEFPRSRVLAQHVAGLLEGLNRRAERRRCSSGWNRSSRHRFWLCDAPVSNTR